MPIRQSFSWWCFKGRGASDAALLKTAKSVGYEAVELAGAELFDQIREAGLKIASHGGHRSIASGLNDPAQHDRIAEEIAASLELAGRYEIPNLIVFSGERRPGLSDEQGIENCILGLQRLAPAAEAAGVTLVMELLNSKVDHPSYQCDHTDWGVQVCRGVGSSHVKLLYDIYHMQIMEGDIIRTINAAHDQFGHYHTAGNPGRNDMDEGQELYYPAILRALLATGYQGYVGHEFVPKGDPLAALEAVYRLCDV